MIPKTHLKKLVFQKFRALNNVEVEFGDHITVVCGKNGTSKSSILGIAAQIFSFEKDYAKGEALSFRQIAGGSFKSQHSEHFRISEKFDVPGSITVNIELHDGYTDQAATAKLELMKRGKSPRPVVRNNSSATENTSRNFTHPVIYLRLKRLYPIAARNYEISDLPMSFSIVILPMPRVRMERSVQLYPTAQTMTTSLFRRARTTQARSFWR